MIIYQIKNKKTNKSYIGQTTNLFRKRKNQHLSLLRKGIHKNPHLQNAWNKYGEVNFKFTEIAKCKSLKKLNELEAKLINELGYYNLRTGGHEHVKISEETKKKIGLKHKNKIITQEQRNTLSKKNTGINHPQCKLNEKDVFFIKYIFKPQRGDISKLSRILKVNRSVICKIYNNVKWTHIPKDMFNKKQITKIYEPIIKQLILSRSGEF